MKQVKLWLATIVALLCSLAANAHDFEMSGIYYKITSSADLTVSVTYRGNYSDSYSDEYSGAVTIPSTVTYGSKTYSVTSIGSSAFAYCSSLTAITLPEGVTSIGHSAFYDCSSLYKVINYSKLSLSIGSTSYGYIAYYAEQIIKGSELTTVGDFQFRTSNGVHYLANYIGKKTDVVLPDNYNGASYNIGDYAFCGCNSLASITLPEGVTSIGKCAFYGCSNLTSITLPAGVTSIGDYAFYGCSLYSVTIPNGLLSIGSTAFSTPKKVIWLTNTPPTGYANAKGSINYVANDQYTNLSNTKVYPYLSSMFEVDGVKYVPVSPSERTCHAIDCAYNSTAESVSISETTSFKGVAMKVTEVMPYTFYGNDHVKEVSVSHLGNIGYYAFYDCDAIENVTISNQDDIGEQAFYDCNGIKTIEVNNRGNICDQAFSGCTSLKSVALGDSIGSLGNQAFYQCTSLQEIVIPDFVKTVGEYCFSGCSAMKSATIGDGVSNIAAYTFQGCTALEDVVVGNGVTTISNYAFTDCSALTNIELGNSVATINNYAFQNCSSLPEISIPQATTTLGNFVFSDCSKLADVIIENRSTALNLGSNGSSALFADCPLDSVYIGGKITYNTTSSKGYSPFYRNTSLRTVVITDREEQVYENEFYGCTNLQNVTIGNGVKAIGNYAFSGCSSLEGFSFGSSMESIGAEAFSDCTNLTSITSHAAVPPTCGTQALDDINKWNCVLRVPSGYAAAYQAAEQWKEFFFVEDVVEVTTYVLTYMVDGVVYHTEALAHKAPITAIAEPTKEGYTFSGWDEVPETMPAQDITIYGTFAINKYMVSFVVDGVVMAANELEYGSAITVPTMPEREGYTFSGWGEVDETVPAHDVTYEACYVANVYRVFYFVGTKLVHTADVAYGEAIPEYVYEPTEEGDVFVGWIGESYDTMPAHDVTYTANITNDVLQLTIDNSQLTIYDLSGRKIEVDDLRELEKGVYVVNGRKVVINNK